MPLSPGFELFPLPPVPSFERDEQKESRFIPTSTNLPTQEGPLEGLYSLFFSTRKVSLLKEYTAFPFPPSGPGGFCEEPGWQLRRYLVVLRVAVSTQPRMILASCSRASLAETGSAGLELLFFGGKISPVKWTKPAACHRANIPLSSHKWVLRCVSLL